MVKVVWFSRLQPGSDSRAYERWVEQVDYLGAAQIPSILSYQVFRVEGPCIGEQVEEFGYDYVEVAEVTSLAAYLDDLQNHPAAQAIVAEIGQYVRSVGNAWGEPVLA